MSRSTYEGKIGNWFIEFDPPPIPASCGMDWSFWHEDYDGAPEHSEGPPADNRCGHGPSEEDCIKQIDELEDAICEQVGEGKL